MIAGALLLQLMISAKGAGTPALPEPGAPSPAPQLTAQEVREKADTLNLQVYDKGIKLYKQNELDNSVAKAVAAARAEEAAKAQTQAPAKEINVFITEGMSASMVSDYLFRSGVVSDKQAFDEALRSNQLNTKIRSGLYSFGVNHNIQDVVARLTTIPPT
jgi:alkaline phosphatase